jgi:hypothetical protein
VGRHIVGGGSIVKGISVGGGSISKSNFTTEIQRHGVNGLFSGFLFASASVVSVFLRLLSPRENATDN